MYRSTKDGTNSADRKKITAPLVRRSKGRQRICMATAYDFTMARLLDAGGIDILLVGDSLGMVFQGLDTTIPVTLDEVAYHCRAVARGSHYAQVVADMPFMSFQVSPQQALENAGKLMKEGMAHAIKLEGGQEVAEHLRCIARAGIPAMGHVGLTPQSFHSLGGFKVQGKSISAAERLVEDAKALEQAGAYAIVLEAIPPDVAARVTEAVEVPTIGIGAGVHCDGQVLVCYDMLGMNMGHTPKFAKQYAQLAGTIQDAVGQYVSEVREGSFPAAEHSYKPSAAATKFSVVGSSG
jgi:3-methyl-2-oxobutanoate hydroxymethyltransferase